nr:hypothetical protein [Solitalea koreensis]
MPLKKPEILSDTRSFGNQIPAAIFGVLYVNKPENRVLESPVP